MSNPTHTASPANDLRPIVGMPACYTIGSDRYAGTVAAVSRGGRTVVFAPIVVFEHGLMMTANAASFTLRAGGIWRPQGLQCGRLTLGDTRTTDLDPGF